MHLYFLLIHKKIIIQKKRKQTPFGPPRHRGEDVVKQLAQV